MPFVKFPETPHILNLGSAIIRNDKILSEIERSDFFKSPLCVEEKVDGTNIGFSLAEDGTILVQNRGSYIEPKAHAQFRKLKSWIHQHNTELFELLFPDRILFGEWCFATHTIPYDRLPDWFLAFDIYDIGMRKFLSRDIRHNILKDSGIEEAPYHGNIYFQNEIDLIKLLNYNSVFYDGPVEGIYLRLEENGYLLKRTKIVRPDFIQSIEEHWSRKELKANRLKRSLSLLQGASGMHQLYPRQ